MKTGILLLNLGGPGNLKEVKPFLYNLFSDPDILVGIPTPFRQGLAFFISQIKGPGSVKMYEKIGGGSPILKWTQSQAEGLLKNLHEKGHDVEIAIGMRTTRPNIQDGLEKLREAGVQRLVLLPLFPQFSTTTTGSCFKEVDRQLKKMAWSPLVEKLKSWADEPSYIKLLRKTLDEAITRAQKEGEDNPYVLFSAHSLPMKIIEKGDPYPQDVDKTVKSVTQGLKNRWSLAFQSRNGPVPWLKPYTEDELVRLGQEGIKNIIVVPISFVSDHIETLFEIDQLYADIAKENGYIDYRRTRSFNDDPEFCEVLETLVTRGTKEVQYDRLN